MKICIIPETPRCISTFLTKLIAHSINGYDLNEYFSLHRYIIPRTKKNKTGYGSIKIIGENNLIKLLKEKQYERINLLVKENWQDYWYYVTPSIQEEEFIKKQILINNESEKIMYDVCLNEIQKIEHVCLKIFPNHIDKINKKLNINILAKLRKFGYKFIFLRPNSLLKICISLVLAMNTGIFNIVSDKDNLELQSIIDKEIIADKEIVDYVKLESELFKGYLDLFEGDENHVIISDQDVLSYNLESKIGIQLKYPKNLPRQLYPNFIMEDKLKLISNREQFVSWVFKAFI